MQPELDYTGIKTRQVRIGGGDLLTILAQVFWQDREWLTCQVVLCGSAFEVNSSLLSDGQNSWLNVQLHKLGSSFLCLWGKRTEIRAGFLLRTAKYITKRNIPFNEPITPVTMPALAAPRIHHSFLKEDPWAVSLPAAFVGQRRLFEETCR